MRTRWYTLNMAVYMISYDLNAPGQKYGDLIDVLKSFPGYLHALKSTWFVESNQSADRICRRLEAVVDDDDEVIVVAVRGQAAWTSSFPEATSDWLMDSLDRA